MGHAIVATFLNANRSRLTESAPRHFQLKTHCDPLARRRIERNPAGRFGITQEGFVPELFNCVNQGYTPKKARRRER